MMLMPPAGVPASSTFYLLWFFSCCCLTTSASAGAHRRPGGSNRRGTPTRSTTDEAATAAACTSPTKTGGSSIQRVVSFPCGGRGCSSTVPYLVPTSNGAHDATVDVPARKSSGARVTGRRRQRQQSSSSTVVTPDDDDSRNGVLVNRKAYSWVTGGRSGGRRGGGLVGYGPECFVESSGGGLDEKKNGGEAEERTASELDLEEANAEVEQGISSDFSVGRIRGGASGGNVVGSVGTGPDRRFETGTEVASRSPNAGVLLGSLLSRIRGGGPGGHAWFSGYSDTEEEEGEDEEGPDYDTDYDSDSESDDGLTGKEGEGVEAGEGDDSGDEEDGDPGDEESSSMARNDALPSAREIVEDAQASQDDDDDDGHDDDHEGNEMEHDEFYSEEDDDRPWCARNPALRSSRDLKNEEASKTDGTRDSDESNTEGRKCAKPDKSKKKKLTAKDIYARTVARRMVMMSLFGVARRALWRSAILLTAFQILPWLKYNPLARWLLGLSLLLQTANEIFRAFSHGKDVANRSGGEAEESSGEAGMMGSSPRVGLVSGLLKAISPEHEQHLEFMKLNDRFDKDVEALAVASRSKAEQAALLVEGAAQDSRMLGASVLKAFIGRGGPTAGAKSPTDTVRTEKEGKTEKRRRRSRRRHKSTASDPSIPAPTTITDATSGTVTAATNTSVPDFAASGDTEPESVTMPAEEAMGDGNGVESVRSDSNRVDGGVSGGDAVGKGSNSTDVSEGKKVRKRLFVVNFGGEKRSLPSEDPVQLLSETVSFLAANGNKTTDEMVLCLESGGGEVTEFGLMAATLARVRDSGIPLTVCVDKIAASGGYMMACVADWLVVAPFAMLGSIGVLGGIANFNKALKRAGVEYFHFTAGDSKSLVGPFQEVTKAQQAKQQHQLDVVHAAFKRHIKQYRPTVDVDMVGTGEVWLGLEAVEMKLADEINTSGQYLQGRMSEADVFLVKAHQKKAMKGASSIVRQLLLGPLASSSQLLSSLVAIANALRYLSSFVNGGPGQKHHRSGTMNNLGLLSSSASRANWCNSDGNINGGCKACGIRTMEHDMLPPATGFFPHPSSTGDCSTTTTTSNTCRPGLLSGCSEVEAMSNAGGLPRDGFSTAASGVFAATSGIVANPGVAPSVGDALFVGVESPACK